jgi:hypothetical protein
VIDYFFIELLFLNCAGYSVEQQMGENSDLDMFWKKNIAALLKTGWHYIHEGIS